MISGGRCQLHLRELSPERMARRLHSQHGGGGPARARLRQARTWPVTAVSNSNALVTTKAVEPRRAL